MSPARQDVKPAQLPANVKLVKKSEPQGAYSIRHWHEVHLDGVMIGYVEYDNKYWGAYYEGKKIPKPGMDVMIFPFKEDAALAVATYHQMPEAERKAEETMRQRRAETEKLRLYQRSVWIQYENSIDMKPFVVGGVKELVNASKQHLLKAFGEAWRAYRRSIPDEDLELKIHTSEMTVGKALALDIPHAEFIGDRKKEG